MAFGPPCQSHCFGNLERVGELVQSPDAAVVDCMQMGKSCLERSARLQPCSLTVPKYQHRVVRIAKLARHRPLVSLNVRRQQPPVSIAVPGRKKLEKTLGQLNVG